MTAAPRRLPVPALRRVNRLWRGTDLVRADRPILWIFAAAFVISCISRMVLAPDRTLWLDEAWTLGIAGLPDWPSTLQQVWLDANAPLYPLLIHGWAQLAGTSDGALRLPSQVFSLATPVLVAGWRGDGLRVEDRLALAACSEGRSRAFAPEDLAGLRVPTLVVAGARDLLAGSPEGLAEAIPGAHAVTLPGCDHFGTITHALFKGRVFDFFDGWLEVEDPPGFR